MPQPTRIIVKGSSKQQVGQVAAVIRKQRPPEPYKGKGIRYEGEYVARKVGKRRMTLVTAPSAASSGAAASAPRCTAPPSGRGSPSSAPTAASSPSSSTTTPAARWPPSTGRRTTCARSSRWSRPAAPAQLLAERANAAGVEAAVFDRGGYQYHGRVKALAEGAREGGLTF